MAKIKDVIYCLNTKNENNDGNTNANGILTYIAPEYVPGSFSFSVIIELVGLGTEEHEIKIEIRNENDEIVIETNQITLPKQINESNAPDEYVGINLSIDWQNVVFKKSGLYSTVVWLDSIKNEFPMYVKGKNE